MTCTTDRRFSSRTSIRHSTPAAKARARSSGLPEDLLVKQQSPLTAGCEWRSQRFASEPPLRRSTPERQRGAAPLAGRCTPELLHPEAQRVGMQAQHFGGVAGAVDSPAALAQRLFDVAAFHRFERLTAGRTARSLGQSLRLVEPQSRARRSESSPARSRSRVPGRCRATRVAEARRTRMAGHVREPAIQRPLPSIDEIPDQPRKVFEPIARAAAARSGRRSAGSTDRDESGLP